MERDVNATERIRRKYSFLDGIPDARVGDCTQTNTFFRFRVGGREIMSSTRPWDMVAEAEFLHERFPSSFSDDFLDHYPYRSDFRRTLPALLDEELAYIADNADTGNWSVPEDWPEWADGVRGLAAKYSGIVHPAPCEILSVSGYDLRFRIGAREFDVRLAFPGKISDTEQRILRFLDPETFSNETLCQILLEAGAELWPHET